MFTTNETNTITWISETCFKIKEISRTDMCCKSIVKLTHPVECEKVKQAEQKQTKTKKALVVLEKSDVRLSLSLYIYTCVYTYIHIRM